MTPRSQSYRSYFFVVRNIFESDQIIDLDPENKTDYRWSNDREMYLCIIKQRNDRNYGKIIIGTEKHSFFVAHRQSFK